MGSGDDRRPAGEDPADRPRTVHVPVVVQGLVLVAVGVVVLARQALDLTWDWRWSVAGVLVVAGVAVVLTTAVTALRAAWRGRRRR